GEAWVPPAGTLPLAGQPVVLPGPTSTCDTSRSRLSRYPIPCNWRCEMLRWLRDVVARRRSNGIRAARGRPFVPHCERLEAREVLYGAGTLNSLGAPIPVQPTLTWMAPNDADANIRYQLEVVDSATGNVTTQLGITTTSAQVPQPYKPNAFVK